MARVASGGELARIALALKTVLSRAETRPTLIFDEIDVRRQQGGPRQWCGESCGRWPRQA